AGQLFHEYASADITSNIIDIYPDTIEPKEILLKYSNVCQHIGNTLDKDEIHDILRAMKMELKPVDEDSLLVKVPTNKADVTREIDLIEEILRIYGFNKVDMPDKLRTTIIHKAYPSKRQVQNMISDNLSSNGFNEMMGISLIESKYYEDADLSKFVFINNTSNIHLDIMRPDALVSGLKSVAHNLNHQQTDLRLYEFGRTYVKGDGFIEDEFLAVYMTGKDSRESWNNQGRSDTDFYGIKEIVDRVFDKVKIDSYSAAEIVEHPWIEFGLNYSNKTSIVDFGKISKSLLSKMGIQQDIYFALFDFSVLFQACTDSSVEVREISRYPRVRRDLALVLDDQVKFSQIRDITRGIDKKLITDIGLFDVYKNEKQLGKGKKSYAVKFIFQDFKKTLKDKEVEKVMKKLISAFERELGAQIRT
ncbi:MAG: phenylalanine--tRNA ligase subunit beta, partial [Bacteroidia bacterium]|nr:phenylalanine--tRNA ligase subunit beta [Bacteroidia bacterium]